MYCLLIAVAVIGFIGCKDVGFRELPDASEVASSTSALEAMQAIETALDQYKQRHGDYPQVTETHLFDSLSKYFLAPIDQAHLYLNEREKANYIAIGNRRNKIVYRYPGTIGSGEYTLYWVGSNGVDEEGGGDDRFPIRKAGSRAFTRRILRKSSKNGVDLEYILQVTGTNPKKDSMLFHISNGEKKLYSDRWPVANYVRNRLDLTDLEQRDVIAQEVARFFSSGHFIQMDSLNSKGSTLMKLRASGKWSPSRLKDIREVFIYSPSQTMSIIAFYDPRKIAVEKVVN
jgi:hypothetical protein